MAGHEGETESSENRFEEPHCEGEPRNGVGAVRWEVVLAAVAGHLGHKGRAKKPQGLWPETLP